MTVISVLFCSKMAEDRSRLLAFSSMGWLHYS